MTNRGRPLHWNPTVLIAANKSWTTKFQLRQYVPDERVVGHSANIGELDVESDDDDEEYILVSKLGRLVQWMHISW